MRTRLVHAVVLGAALIFIFVLGAARRAAGPADAHSAVAWLPEAAAAPAACPVPSLDRVAGTWVVSSSRCTSASCLRPHLNAGDRLTFDRDISGEANFSLRIVPNGATAVTLRTEGYALRSDGVAGIKGPLVVTHDPREGNPLDLHWLIVDIRSYDPDGSGVCKLTGRVQVCTAEPRSGATACSDEQSGGSGTIDPPK